MPAVSFGSYLEGEGLSFGLPKKQLDALGRSTEAGSGCTELLDDPKLNGLGVGPTHILRIRRAWRRYRALSEVARDTPGEWRDRVGPAAVRWATRHAKDQAQKQHLVGAFATVVAATLKRGRLRIHLKHPDDPRLEELSSLAEHTEGCDEIPPHRWFAANRGVADGLLWIEVLPPDKEVENCLGPEVAPMLLADLTRASAKPVLDSIGERAERQVIAAAADTLYALMSRPSIDGPVAGVTVNRKKAFVCIVGGEADGEGSEFDVRELDRLAAWVEKLGVRYLGVARVGGLDSTSGLIKLLSSRGISVEPVREAGLMKQARGLAGPIKSAAAKVVARRLKDPLEGYAGLGADELGIGEYLDRVNPDRLHLALEDVREVVSWERQHGKTAGPVARGVTFSPMVKNLSDLRPGLELMGVVANLTHFGAFVELGLAVQGMIHLSELSDDFVRHPAEVVQVGDRVRVRVVEVDEQRGRISLSLRTDRGARRAARDRRAQAIQELGKLFKK